MLQARRASYNPVPVLFLALVLCALAVLALQGLGSIDLSFSHGEAKHGTAALTVRQCIDQNGPMQTWQNAQTGRRALLCQMPDGKYGIQIVQFNGKAWQEITTFIKDKMSNLGQVVQYLKNVGYEPIQ
jgi:putative hemolysin